MNARHRPSGVALLLTGGVREALWAQPLIRALPGVTVFARSEAMRTLQGIPEVGRAFSFGSSAVDVWRTYRRLRAGPMSMSVVAAPSGARAALLEPTEPAPNHHVRGGSVNGWSGALAGRLRCFRLQDQARFHRIHPVDANREIALVAAGMTTPPPQASQPPTIQSGVPATRRMQSLLVEAGVGSLRETLVLIPGSGNWTPRAASAIWPEERFAVLANQASANAVILAGGLGDDARVRETRAGIGKPTTVIRLSELTVEEFAIVAGGSQAVVGHDGDALHVAAASGASVVALLRPHDVTPEPCPL